MDRYRVLFYVVCVWCLVFIAIGCTAINSLLADYQASLVDADTQSHVNPVGQAVASVLDVYFPGLGDYGVASSAISGVVSFIFGILFYRRKVKKNGGK